MTEFAHVKVIEFLNTSANYEKLKVGLSGMNTTQASDLAENLA